MNWIDINNKKPNNYQDAIICRGDYVGFSTYWEEGHNDDGPGFYAESCGYDGSEFEILADVTHWMPLPEPPLFVELSARRTAYQLEARWAS